MEHLTLNLDRLRLLSEEDSTGRRSSSSNVERWLNDVEESSKDAPIGNVRSEETLPNISPVKTKAHPVYVTNSNVRNVNYHDGRPDDLVHTAVRNFSQRDGRLEHDVNFSVRNVTQRDGRLDSGVESDSVFTSVSNASRQKRSISLTDTVELQLQQNLKKHLSRRSSRNIPTPINERTHTRLYHPLSIRTYRKACKRLKILPMRRIMGQFGRTRFILNELCLSRRDIKAVCKGLLFEDTASYLDFSGNSIGPFECGYVLEMLAHNHLITELRLAENRLSGEGITLVNKYFMDYNVITVLDISGNKLTDRDGQSVATIIKVSPQLRVLHAHHNEFREQGSQAIGQVIASYTCCLEELDLSWNHIRLHGAVSLAKGIEKNKSLEYINLGWNGFAYEGCVALSDALRRNTCLERLDISCNRIHPPALMELMKGLVHNKVLKILIMDKNPLTPSFTSVFLETIQRSHQTMALQELSLQGVVVDRDFRGILDDIQRERPLLVEYETALPVSCRSRDDMLNEVKTRNNYNIEPLRMLYLLKEKNRAQDFFHKINKDHDDGLEPEELSTLFKESGMPVSQFVIDKIMNFMDTDGDGKIDLGEFLVGDKKMKKLSRDITRNTPDEPTTRRYSRTFRKAHVEQLSSRLKVEDAYQYLSPIASASNSPASSRRSSINF